MPVWLGAQSLQPELLVLVNGERILLENDTIELKSSDQLTIFDTLTATASGVYIYKLQNKDTLYKHTRIASYNNLKAGSYTFHLYISADEEEDVALAQPFTIIVNRDNTWWYIPAFVLYLVILSGSAVYVITINKVRHTSKIYTLRSDWTDRLHTDIGGDLLGVSGRITMAQEEVKSLIFNVQNNLVKAQDILSSVERKLRFVFDLIDPKKNSLQTILNDLHWHAQECFAMKNIELDYQNSLPENQILKIALSRIEKLGLIAKEVVNNSYKHSEATHFSLHVKRERKALWLQMTDNGKGFDLDAKLNEPNHKNGNGNGGRIGLKSLFSLAKEGLMDITVQAEPAKGTTVTISVPEL